MLGTHGVERSSRHRNVEVFCCLGRSLELRSLKTLSFLEKGNMKVIYLMLLTFLSTLAAFAQEIPPVKVAYECDGFGSGQQVGELDFQGCIAPFTSTQDAKRCFFGKEFLSTYGTQVVSVSFLVPARQRLFPGTEICLSASGSSFSGNEDTEYDFAYNAYTTSRGNSLPTQTLSNCATWVKIARSFQVGNETYKLPAPFTSDALRCNLIVNHVTPKA